VVLHEGEVNFMADPEHLRMTTFPKAVYYLSDRKEVDLSEADLSGLNIRGVELRGANLRGVNLRGANLRSVNLRGANLRGANLKEADLSRLRKEEIYEIMVIASVTEEYVIGIARSGADLSGADLSGADLSGADLSETLLSRANLSGANLSGLDLSEKDLSNADLREANLSGTNLSKIFLYGANMSKANLIRATIIEANLENAVLTSCSIYGIAVWDVQLEGAKQEDLVITLPNQPVITVDNLKIAQFIYLLLNNEEIRDVIDTITYKVVLILGRFTPERKRVLDALRVELRKKDYLPMVFDFQKPANRDLTETVSTLAHLARFIIADITDPKSIPQELKTIVPNLPSVVVQPLLHARSKEYGMFEHFKSFPWVLEAHRYTTVDRLLASLKEHVIEPAEQKARELAVEKAKRQESS
jgi:uncharacterized protein YjbI with pentapeptide repeats